MANKEARLRASGIHFTNPFRSVVISMAEPSLEDTMPDIERLTWAVEETLGVQKVEVPFCVMVKLAANVQKKPFLITEHGIYSRERETEIVKCGWAKGDFKSVWIQYFYNIAKLAYRSADMVVTLFEQNAVIEQELGCDPAKIRIVPNGVRMERFRHIGELRRAYS